LANRLNKRITEDVQEIAFIMCVTNVCAELASGGCTKPNDHMYFHAWLEVVREQRTMGMGINSE
jgi:hypothetical protein